MTDEEVLAEFRAAEALLEGHFILSSGRRSGRYLQCARVLMDPARAARLAEALVATLPAPSACRRCSSNRRKGRSSSAAAFAGRRARAA